MSGDIHEMSKLLGKLQSDITHVRKTTDATELRVNKTHDDLLLATASLKSAHKRIDDIKLEIKDEIHPPLLICRDNKNKALGAASVWGGAAGLMVVAIGALVRGWFS